MVTDASFVEGVIEGMKELGLEGSQMYIREVNCPEDFEMTVTGIPLTMEQAVLRDEQAPI